ncbi:MAG: ATP-binding cassette domain-containing protein [Caldilineales bacterium]|nr:ATP-binding cassette domain-containing protein [Caldilineales bacterium]
MSPTPILSAQDIKHRYDQRMVLNLPRLEVHEGELLAIVGPSGAGKSTLLRLFNFLEMPNEGAVSYRGQAYEPDTLPIAIRRRITTVFQQPLLLDMSVRRNISYGLRLRRDSDGHEREEAALAAVGLSHLAGARPRNLSGGEAQRVSLARALVLEPEVLLLDEPTANLDPTNVRIIEEIVTKANGERGTTVVLVTHNVWQARRLAHRVGFLYEGELLETAPTHDFFENPQNPRTAAFLSGELVY